uniref:Uncharacterized protein n=1 Tax=viral metagenome TaxID=1070528 RepID=A0A6H1ZEM7_9ZZZZ
MKEHLRIKGTYLQADTANGVRFADISEDPEAEVMKPQDFYDSLRDLEDGEVIYSYLYGADEELFDKINDEYGIRPGDISATGGLKRLELD